MKRILFLAADLCSRGAERQMVTVACLLKDAGHDVSFVCYHTNNFFEYILKNNGIPVRWLHLPNYIKRMLEIRKHVRKGDYDVVISFLQADNFLNDFAALGRHDWKVITGERSSKESMLTSRRGKTFTWFQRQTDYLVCNSENAKQMWIKHYPRYADKLKVVYNHVHLQPINSEYVIRKDGKTHIMVAGAYAYVKNPQCLIRALGLLDDNQRKRLHVDWYGKIGANEEAELVYKDCKILIRDLNLEDVVSLKDATSEASNRMFEADVIALFSRWEGLPNAICEGMAIGKPILMTRVSDYNVLIDDNNGWLCDAGSIESAKVALEMILKTTDEELIRKGSLSKEKAERLFSGDKILEEWIKLID